MQQPLPVVLIPGLCCSARLYGHQIPALWRLGPVTVACQTQDETIGAIARRILSDAPPSFAMVGLSMGGFIAFEILRQQPQRVIKAALLDTSARPDSPESIKQRQILIDMAEHCRFGEIPDLRFPLLVHPSRHSDDELRQVNRLMAEDTGAPAYVRQQRALISRPDSRPCLGAIMCPTLVMVGDGDQLTPPECSAEIAAGVAGARLVTIPQCGHLATLEQPDFVTSALVEFLADVILPRSIAA